MKKLGKKAGQGATGKAASMKKADVPGEWLYFAPEAVDVRQIADVLDGTCELEICALGAVVSDEAESWRSGRKQAYLRLCTVEKPPWTWRKGKSIPGIR